MATISKEGQLWFEGNQMLTSLPGLRDEGVSFLRKDAKSSHLMKTWNIKQWAVCLNLRLALDLSQHICILDATVRQAQRSQTLQLSSQFEGIRNS